jgi:hypothetical protein
MEGRPSHGIAELMEKRWPQRLVSTSSVVEGQKPDFVRQPTHFSCSHKKSKQKKCAPAVRVPFAALRGNLRCSAQGRAA